MSHSIPGMPLSVIIVDSSCPSLGREGGREGERGRGREREGGRGGGRESESEG